MGINLHIQQFKEKLANVINDSKLPPTIVQMVLNEITAQVNILTAQAIEAEKKALAESDHVETSDEQQELKEGDKDGKEIHKD